MSEDLLDVANLQAFYGRAQILFDVSLTVRRGEVVALMGRNGAGKSTTFKTLMGHIDRNSGRVGFLGHEILGMATHKIARLGLGYVPEDRRIFADLTVMENLAVGRRAKRAGLPEWTPEALFDIFPNLKDMRNRPAGRMSGGEQQMLTVARTLMGNPAVLMLDEPSEGVAPVIVDAMARTIQKIKGQGVSVLLSEQNLRFAETVSDRVYVIEKGCIRFSGTMSELSCNDTAQHRYLSL